MASYTTLPAGEDLERNSSRNPQRNAYSDTQRAGYRDSQRPAYRDDPPDADGEYERGVSRDYNGDDRYEIGDDSGDEYDDGEYDGSDGEYESDDAEYGDYDGSRQLGNRQPNRACNNSRCAKILTLTILIAALAGGKIYHDHPEDAGEIMRGFVGRVKGGLERFHLTSRGNDLDGSEGDGGGEGDEQPLPEIGGVEGEVEPMGDEEAPEEESAAAEETQPLAQDTNEEEESEQELTPEEEEPEQEEPLTEEEEVQPSTEEHPQEATQVQETTGQQEANVPKEVNYMTGATGTISKAWSVVEQVDHDVKSFTQGLSISPLTGQIYESTGLTGQSKLRSINPNTFKVDKSVRIDYHYFGEGSTWFTEGNEGRIIAITWQSQLGFVYDENLNLLKTFEYTTTPPANEGWGISYIPPTNEFVVSDGSSQLYFWDVDTLKQKRVVQVTRLDGRSQDQLNELEYMDGLVCANIWHVDEIVCVDPETGKSVREYDMSTLYPSSERGDSENVLNGIALGPDYVLLTGKRWDRMYKVTLDDWPSLFVGGDALEENIVEEETVSHDASEENIVEGETVSEESESVLENEGDDVNESADNINQVVSENGESIVEGTDQTNESTESVDLEEQNVDVNTDTTVQDQSLVGTYTVIEQVTHDKTRFTQGLSYGKDGYLYETTGLYANSKLIKIDPVTLEEKQSVKLDGRYFGEGSTFFTDANGNSRIIEITWKSQTGFIYDADTLDTLSTFQYTTTPPRHEGWGITYDESNQQFIVSDGSAYLYFWDRDSLEEKGKVAVTRLDGRTQDQLNELEFMDGLVCCNIWHVDEIICVDPVSGKSVKEYDMSELWPSNQRGGGENVLNGIALGKDHVLVTGKRWDRMYKITLDDWPTLFASSASNFVIEESKEPEESSTLEDASSTVEDVTTEVEETENDAMKELEKEVEGLPDYFVPLTEEERAALKQRLHDTISKTSLSLLSSANPSQAADEMLPQRTFKLDPTFSKQFMHMHHMKTGGTSMDNLIHCAISRQLQVNNNTKIQYSSMSECGSGVRSCMEKLATELNASVVNNVFYHNDDDGNPIMDAPFDPAIGDFESKVGDLNICKTSDCGVMSYCASLHTVRTFGWKDVDKITVIRNPIDRAWSMYRFTLQSCYKCDELKDVLKQILNGTFLSGHQRPKDGGNPESREPNFAYEPSNSCAVQLIGHQATNLLSSNDLYNVANDVRFPREQEIVEEAVRNLRESFTWIGLTDRLPDSVEGFRAVFPFLAENLTEAVLATGKGFEAKGHQLEDAGFSLPENYVDTKSCPFPHQNAGRDPTCGTTEMDNETINLILKLNNRDRAVYQAAVERFELQMEVLEEYKST